MKLAPNEANQPWTAQDVAEFCAILTTILVFLSGTEVCVKIFMQKSTHNASYAPFITGVINCFLWLEYGMYAIDRTIILVNLIGLLLQLGYSAVYYIYTSNKTAISKNFTAVAIVLGILHLLALLTDSETARLISGLLACAAVIIFIGSPLMDIANVIRNKSVESMPFTMILLTLCMASCWCMYGALVNDYFVIIPNFLGALVSLLELILYYIYSPRYKYVSLHDGNNI